MEQQLTKHFKCYEFITSREHPEMLEAIRESWTDKDTFKCYLLAKIFLEPLRTTWQAPITILSGKRSEALNAAIKGSPTSDHLFIEGSAACDFTAPAIKQMALSLSLGSQPYGQMIWYPLQNFIHVSLPTEKHFREALTKIGTKIYQFGQEPK